MERESAVDAIVRALRKVNFQGSVFGQTIAARLGLSESDIRTLELLVDADPVTAGRIAELLNLSTGAVTRILDRLEQAGYVRRAPDPADRRRVVVEVVPERLSAIREALEPLGDADAIVVAAYSDKELEVINDFLTRMADAQRSRADALREDPGTFGGTGEHSAPLGALREARLLFRPGVTDMTITGGLATAELFRARFEGTQPSVRVRDGTVVVAYRGGMREIFDWRKRSAAVDLNPTIPWSVQVHGGMSKARASLDRLDLRSFELTGGADRVRVGLGVPTDVVPVRLTGGANVVHIERPADVAIRMRLKGGASGVVFDEQRLGSALDVVLESPGAGSSPNRFEVEVTGGANRVTVGRRAA